MRALSSRWILLVAAAGIIVQTLVRGPSRDILGSAALNAGHAPLYGLVALGILQLLRPVMTRRGISPVRLYLLTFLLTFAAGAAAELLQLLAGRDAEAVDIARDAAGAAGFLLLASAFDRGWVSRPNRPPRIAMLLAALLPLAIAFASLAMTVSDFLRRDAAFPKICGFDASWENRFVSTGGADMEKSAPPAGWRTPSSRVARLTFRTGLYPGLAIRQPYPDWRGFKELVLDAFSELPEPVELVLRVHDREHDNAYSDRFNRTVKIEPGVNRVAIPLQDVESAPRGRKMDMSRIWGVVLFAVRPPEPFVLYIDDLHLE